jgi:hypothetical protein
MNFESVSNDVLPLGFLDFLEMFMLQSLFVTFGEICSEQCKRVMRKSYENDMNQSFSESALLTSS